MIYIVALVLPPLGLLLNGQPFAAILNIAAFLFCSIQVRIHPAVILTLTLSAFLFPRQTCWLASQTHFAPGRCATRNFPWRNTRVTCFCTRRITAFAS